MENKFEKEEVGVSLVIPIYNTEKFIERCLCSVFEQTFRDVEYILINDCTPDGSIGIAERIIKSYPDRCITLLANEVNRGSAGVRNRGIKAAKGKYIIFIDSDDYVEPTMLEDMYKEAEMKDADVVIADYYINYPQKQVYSKQTAPSSGTECSQWILSGLLHSSNSNKLIKKELYAKNKISFIEGVNMWEDMSTIPRVCYFADKVVYLPKAYLHYVQYNENSYTSNLTAKSLLDIQTAIEVLQSFFQNNDEYKKALSFLRLKAKIDFVMHTKGEERKRLCRLYNEPKEMIIEHPSLSLFYKLLLLSEKYKLFCLIDFLSYLYYAAKKILRHVNK